MYSSENPWVIGQLDAWEERSFLKTHFVSRKQFEQLVEEQKSFLFGRKGSGKSAIAILIDEGELTSFFYRAVFRGELHTYASYLEHAKSLQKIHEDQGNPLKVKHYSQLLWSYIFRVIFLDETARQIRGLNPKDKQSHLPPIDKYLNKKGLHNKDISTLLSILHTNINRHISQNPKSTNPTIEYLQLLNDERALNDALREAKLAIAPHAMLLVFDTLESYEIHEPIMKEIFRGIISAVYEICLDRKQLSNLRVLFSLPSEIFEEISDEKPAKVKSKSLFLDWRNSELCNMIAVRYLNLLTVQSLGTDGRREVLSNLLKPLLKSAIVGAEARNIHRAFWYESGFLPSFIKNRLGMKEDTLLYIIRHTQKRPRELLVLFNSIIETAYEKGELPRISEESVRQGIHKPGTLSLLLSETLSPFRHSIEDFPAKTRTAFSRRPRVMSLGQLTEFSNELFEVTTIPGMNAKIFLSYLLHAGLIGLIEESQETPEDQRVFTFAEFEYLMQQEQVPLRNDFLYYVHPLLGDTLKMKRVPGFGVVYPKPSTNEDSEWEEFLK